jgi:endonuclease/exonuclease/phosphatase (EEP) superfamily protein YafD
MIETILTGATLFFLTLTILGFRRWIWWFTLFDFFRFQYVLIAMLLLIPCLFLGLWGMAVANLVTIGLNLWRMRDFIPNFSHLKPPGKRTIMAVNTYKENDDYQKIREALTVTDADVLLLMEVNDELEENLRDIFQKYEYRLQTPVRDGFSICLLSRFKMQNTDITYHGTSDTPLLHAEIDIKGTSYHVFSAHPKPALNGAWYHERRLYFSEISDVIAQSNLPPIVLGDFNSVPWERHFVDFCEKGGIKSTSQGYGYKITWPTYFLLMGIPMDHILLPENEKYGDLLVGPFSGSDHYPVAINL